MNLPKLKGDYVYLRDQYEEFGQPQNDEELAILAKVAVDLAAMAKCIQQHEEQLTHTARDG